ncbi:NAD(P)/FAD-dependent oxidoreductase [Roseovarius sp. CH_XMU1461]|uniref:NAD(P)/FAD-dependent oxidoreductase n=1 Tax=Roseovarius sp. CH_XMU1461 TaxID=3107777 RepID=UPI0030084222
MESGVVIVGAGQAGLQAGLSLREGGYSAPITLIGDEAHAPYQRPPLSKTYLASDVAPDTLFIKPRAALASRDITLRDGTRVTAIDRDARTVTLSCGDVLAFTSLILATGTRNRLLPLPGAEAKGVHALRGVDDAQALREALGAARRVAIIGGGFIGLEIAASLRKRAIAVSLFEAGDRLCARACLPQTSEQLFMHQRNIGTDVNIGAQIARIETEAGRAVGIALQDGPIVPADLVLVCIGVVPNTELAEAVELPCDNGVAVDAHLRTADPDIYAIGDCASFPCPDHGRRVRLESVPNATAQGRYVAGSLLGQDAPFRAFPWFWSDQGDLKLQMAGVSDPQGSVDRVATANGQVIFNFSAGRLCAVECINAPAEFVTARKLVSTGAAPTREALIEADWNLRALAKVKAA